MNHHRSPRSPGSSLIETVIAMAVLAVAIPLVFVALTGAGKSCFSAEFETRSPWIVSACQREIQASRAGKPEFLTATKLAETIPPPNEFWAIAFSAEGKPIARMTQSDYQKGLNRIDNTSVRYIAIFLPKSPLENESEPTKSRVRISIEYPSIAPASKRQHLDFYTHLL